MPERASSMEKVASVFRSFAEAEEADREYYHSLTPEARLEILGELIARSHPDEIEQRSERVYRIVKFQKN
jgi:hypothetical protein